MNPRDSDLKITSDGDFLVFEGHKNFNTGGVISDLTILEGVYEGTDHHIFTAVQTRQPGIVFAVRRFALFTGNMLLRYDSTTGTTLVYASPNPEAFA